MARKYKGSDPTANAAIGNVMKDQERQTGLRTVGRAKSRPLFQIFAPCFVGLIKNDAIKVAKLAVMHAGGDIDRVEEHHINQARNALFGRPGGGAA